MSIKTYMEREDVAYMLYIERYIVYGASLVAQLVKNPPAKAGNKRSGFHPWVRKILWKRPWQSTPVFLTGESLDKESWQTTVHVVAKSWA